MSGETLIRIVEDVLLEDGCTNAWRYNPLVESIPNYFCIKHKVTVPLSGPCPKSEFWARKGETVSVPSKVARRLVESDLAEFPTHAPVVDQGIQETVDRVNALMESQGLPGMSAEAMNVWKVDGRRDPYQRPGKPSTKPSHRRLAGSLGMDDDDIAAMRKAAGLS